MNYKNINKIEKLKSGDIVRHVSYPDQSYIVTEVFSDGCFGYKAIAIKSVCVADVSEWEVLDKSDSESDSVSNSVSDRIDPFANHRFKFAIGDILIAINDEFFRVGERVKVIGYRCDTYYHEFSYIYFHLDTKTNATLEDLIDEEPWVHYQLEPNADQYINYNAMSQSNFEFTFFRKM